jgi:hypothetical protein
VFLEVLAACLPGQAVFCSTIRNGTAIGAANLALMTQDNKNNAQKMELRRIVGPPELAENAELDSWFHRVAEHQ